MKKISLLVLVCMILSLVFASCDMIQPETPDEEKHEHAYSADWSFDAVNHYHACTCGSQSDVAKHADANNDGACDTCALVLSNEHVFDTAWTTDATNHWHAALCGHDVVDAKAAHTADEIGNCTVCGVKISAPTIETVADAIELALAQDYAAKAGSVFYSYYQYDSVWYEYRTFNSLAYFEKSEGYLHVTDLSEATQTWYYAVGEDSVWSVVSDSGVVEPNPDAYSVDNLNGFYFNGAILNYSSEAQAYGVADLLDALYFMGEDAPIALESSVVTDEENTVYNFSFGVPDYAGVYLVKVSFTLDQYSYYADNVYVGVATAETESGDVTIEYEVDEEGWPVYDEDGNEIVKSVTLAEGYEPDYCDYYEITQSEELADPISPDDMVMPTFDVKDSDGNVIGETVNATVGSPVTLNIVPNGGNIAMDPVSETVLTADGEETWSCYVNINSDGEVSVNAYAAGTYSITLTSAAHSVTFNLVVAAPAVETFEIGVYDPSTYSYDAKTETTISVNGSFDFKSLVNTYADDSYTYVVTGAEGTYTVKANPYNESINTFTATTAGTYTLTLTSAADQTKTATLTINVIEGEVKTPANVLNGKYEVLFFGGAIYNVTFTPMSEGQTFGYLSVVDNNGGTYTGEYTYGYNDGAIEIMESDFYTLVTTFSITMDANLNMYFNANSNFVLTRVVESEEEETNPADELVDKTYTDGTYYLTFTKYDDAYVATLMDVVSGKPTSVGISFTSYSVEGPDNWDEYSLTLVEAAEGNMGTNPISHYELMVISADFTTITFVDMDSDDQVTYSLYNPYA